MKKIYTLYTLCFVLVVAGAALLAFPPTSVFACGGYASCQYGDSVHIPAGASSCSCTDNVGCSWTSNGVSYSQACAKKSGDEFLIE
jgi:hypothetical protein